MILDYLLKNYNGFQGVFLFAVSLNSVIILSLTAFAISAKEKAIRFYFILNLFFRLLYIILLAFANTHSFSLTSPIIFFLIPFFAVLSQMSFYIFVVKITSYQSFGGILYHLYKPILLLLMNLFFYFTVFTEKNIDDDYFKEISITYFFAILIISSFIYLYLALKCIKYYEKQTGENTLKWLKIVIYLRALSVIFVIIYSLNTNLMSPSIAINIFSDIMVVYFLLQKRYSFIHVAHKMDILVQGGEVIKTAKIYPNNDLSIVEKSVLNRVDFEAYFNNNRPFLDPNFGSEDLVSHFKTNRSYLSKFVNKVYNTNLRNYINSWRMKEFEILKEQHPEKNTEELSKMAGFGSVSSYWRIKKSNNNL